MCVCEESYNVSFNGDHVPCKKLSADAHLFCFLTNHKKKVRLRNVCGGKKHVNLIFTAKLKLCVLIPQSLK